MIKLGFFVKDRVTGLIGIAQNRATFLYGCDRYYVQPRIDKEGKVPEGLMVDEPQLKIIKNKKQVMMPLPEPKQVITLGVEVYDPIVNRKGTATGRAVYLNGCSRIFVEPKHRSFAIEITGWWVDELQLTAKKKVIHKPKQKTTLSGGPARSCSKY